MKTEIQFSIIYPSHTENDINKFEFFIRMAPADGKNIISVVSVPKFSIDGRVVKHLHFCVNSEQSLESQNITCPFFIYSSSSITRERSKKYYF